MFKDKNQLSIYEAGDFFWTLVDFEVVPIITFHFDGTIVTANDAFLSLIGYPLKETKQLSWFSLTPKKYHPLDLNCIEELKAQRIATIYEKQLKRKDGKLMQVRCHVGSYDLGATKKAVALVVGLEAH